MQKLAMVLAMAKNRVIGKDNGLPWHFPEDLRHFRDVTMGHAIIQGRKTYESVKKPLKGRRNIVVTRTPAYEAPGCEVAPSLEAAIELARTTDDEPRIIGGAVLYLEALPLATTIYLTEIDLEPEGDTRLSLDTTGFVEAERLAGADPRLSFVRLERRG